MSEKLKHWEGFKAIELGAIPVVCGSCGAQVTIAGRIEDGELLFGNCPACQAPIEGSLTMGGDEVEARQDPALSAEVSWFVEGGRMPECRIVIGKTTQILDILLSVLTTGVTYYAHSECPQGQIYQLIAAFLINNYTPLRGLPAISQAIAKRLQAQPDVKANSDLYKPENGGRSGVLEILDLGKECECDDDDEAEDDEEDDQ